MKSRKKSFQIFSLVPGLLALSLLISCAGKDGGIGGGGVGSALENALQGGGVGGGQASGKGGDGGGGGGVGDTGDGDSGDGSSDSGGGDSTQVIPLDAGVLAPDQAFPHVPKNRTVANLKILCRLPDGRGRVKISGHVMYLGYDNIKQTQVFYDVEPLGVLRILDKEDKQFIDIALEPYEAPSTTPYGAILLKTRKNQFSVEFTTFLQDSGNPVTVGFAYDDDASVEEDKNGEEQYCPTKVLSDGINDSNKVAPKFCYSTGAIEMEPMDALSMLMNSKDAKMFNIDPLIFPICQTVAPATIQQSAPAFINNP